MLQNIAEYVSRDDIGAEPERESALYHLTNGLADGFYALQVPGVACLLGPGVPRATMAHGARVPGTSLELNPPMAAFNIGAMLGCVELAAILAVADYLARRAHNDGRAPLCVRDLLTALVKARALHALLLDTPEAGTATLAATTAVLAHLLGGRSREIAAAVESAWAHEASREHAAGYDDRRRSAAAAGIAVHWAWAAVHRHEPVPPTAPTLPSPRRAEAAFAGSGAWTVTECSSGGQATQTLQGKFAASVAAHFAPTQSELIIGRFAARATLVETPVNEFMATLVKNG